MTPKKSRIIYTTVSVAVSVTVIGYLLTVVGAAEVFRAIRNASLAGIAAYMVLSLFTSLLRNVRYLVLVRSTGTDIPVTGWQMFLVTLVRNLFSDLLPARIGSLIYIYLLRARFGFPLEIGTSTYAVAFVLDLLVMVPLMCVGVIVVGASKLGIPLAFLLSAAGMFFVLMLLMLLYLGPILRWTGGLVGRTARRWRYGARVAETLSGVATQVADIYKARAFWKVITLSFCIRLFKYGCIVFLVYAVLNPINPAEYTLRSIGYWPVFVGSSIAELSASTPVSGIAGFGAYEGAWTGAFYLLGYPKKLAALSGISAHLITQVFGYTLGVIALLILLAPAAGRSNPRKRSGRPVSRDIG
jgi:uncharacterized protein (TIRG00374 family)